MNRDNLGVEIQASLDKNQSRNNISNDIKSLEKTPFFMRLIAKLYKSLSKSNIENDIKTLEKSAPSIRLNGRLNRATTRRNIRNDVNSLENSANVTLGAQIDRNELQQSVNTARNDIEQNLQNNPINVPININGNINNGTQQVQNLNNQMRNSERILGNYFTARDIFRIIANSIRQVVNEVEDLNKAQTNLQIATSKSATEIKSLMQDYNQLAKDMSSTTLDVTGAADDYLRQGQSIADTNILIKDSLILSKIGQIESGQATEYLTSAMKGYKTEAKDVISIVDKLSAVDLESASNSGELAEAMSKTANVARASGVELDTLIAYLATAKDITQDDASVIGNSFRSIFTRLNNIKIGKFLDEDGNDISGEINDAERVLSKFNISLRDNAKEFRDAQDIIADVANSWGKMSSVDQAAIRKAFANTYQAEKFTAIMENYNKVLQLTEVSQNSAGTAMEKFSIYENSLEAATNRLTASLEGLAYNTIDGDFLKGLANATAGIVEFVDSTKLLKTGLTAGIFTGAIAGLVALGTRMIAVRNNVTQFTQAMNLSRSTTALMENQFTQLMGYVNGLSRAQLRCVLSSRQLNDEQRISILTSTGLTRAEAQAQLQTWNLTNATNAQTTATFSLRGAWEGLKASIATNPIGLVVTALTLATTAITTLKQKQEELRESISETAKEAKEQTDNLNDLISSYEEFAGKISYTAEEKEKLKDIQEQLSDLYHKEVDDIDLVNGKYDEEIAKLKELKKEKLQDAELSLVAEREQAAKDSSSKGLTEQMKKSSMLLSSDWFKSEDDYNNIIKEFSEKLKDGFSTDIAWASKWVGYDSELRFYGDAEDRVKKIQEAMSILKDYGYTNIGLYSELNKLLSEYQGYVDTESEAVSNLAENMFQQYELDNPYKEVGQDSYIAWRDGLLATAEDDGDLRKQLLILTEKQFPDYSKYFTNLSKARSMFVRANSASEAAWAKEKDNFLDKLSPEDLEIATQIPDLFADGLNGATAKIEAWKADPNNKITADVDTSDLNTIIETTSKKVKLITTAMEEMNDTGYISSSTYAEIVEMGGNFADCLEIQNGKLKLNVQKLKELERQETLNAIAAKDLAISELNVAAAMAGQSRNAEKVEEIRKQITALEKERAVLWQINDEIANAEPDEKKSSDPWKDEAESKISKIKHLEAMGEISHEEYINRLEEINQKYFANRVKYEDEFNKYEEEIYKDRKDREQDLFDQRIDNYEKLADKALEDNDFEDARTNVNTQITETQNRIIELKASGKQDVDDEIKSLEESLESLQDKITEINRSEIEFNIDNMNDYIDELEESAEKIEETSMDSDGTKLDSQGKWRAIRDAYIEAANVIQAEIDRIVQAGVEGNEDLLKELEDQLEEYQEKISDTFKSAVEEEKDYIDTQKDAFSDAYDERIDKIKEEKEAAEEAAQAEIDALEEKINALEKANEKAEEANDIEKARQELEKAKNQRTIATVSASGTISYQADKEKVQEAQEEYDKLLKEQQINLLEDQKDLLEKTKDKQSEAYDAIIDNLEKEKEAGERQFDILLKVLDDYLNPDKSTSNIDVWSILAKTEGIKLGKNGQWVDKDGKVIDIEKLMKSSQTETDAEKNVGNNSSDNKNNTNGTKLGRIERRSFGSENETELSTESETISETESALDKLLANWEKMFDLEKGSLTIEKAQQVLINSPTMKYNPYEAMNERMNRVYRNEYVSNVNNNNSDSNVTFSGDININNPVTNSYDLAEDIVKNLPNAVAKQIHKKNQ